jgi:hypothetical protein
MPTGAGLCRLNDKVFSVVAVAASNREMVALAESVHTAYVTGGEPLHVGVVHFGTGSGSSFTDPGEVVRAAVAALNASRAEGAKSVCVASNAKAA